MIRLIAALDEKRGIGKNGDQPFYIKTDLARFRELTMGSPVLMGYGAYKAIGHPLKGRPTYVASRDPKLSLPGCHIVSDVDSYLKDVKEKGQELWVIGGGQMFNLSIGLASELYLTEIKGDFDCDAFFPDYHAEFELAGESDWQTEDKLTYRFTTWRRKG